MLKTHSNLIINLLKDYDNSVLEINLARPKSYNALNIDLLTELDSVLNSISSKIRIIIIQGENFPDSNGFTAGHDLKEMLKLSNKQQKFAFNLLSTILQKFKKLDQIVITNVHGFAYASGCQIVCASDLAYSLNTAKFATSGINLNFFCATPMIEIINKVPTNKAFEMLFLGQSISASEAKQLGMITDVFTKLNAKKKIDNIINNLLSKDPVIVSNAKKLFYQTNKQLNYQAAIDHMTWQIKQEPTIRNIKSFFTK